jgi:hypothetical protein
MIPLNADYRDINPEQLHAEIKAALDSRFFGLSTYGSERPITLWLDDTASDDDMALAVDLVATHVPEVSLMTEQTSLENQIANLQAQLDQLQTRLRA